MKLTDTEMHQAHFARYVDMDPDTNYLPEDKRARAWASSVTVLPGESAFTERCVKDYRVGKEILALYTLTYSPRFRAAGPSVPLQYTDHITIEAGFLACDQAFRIAMFKPREGSNES